MGTTPSSVVIKTTVAAQLEILCFAKAFCLCVIERKSKADSFDGFLLHAVQVGRRGYPAEFVERRHDIDGVKELGSQPVFLFNPFRPGDDHRITRSPEVAGDLLRPLEWRVHRMGPSGRKMVEVLWTAEFIDRLDVVLPFLREPVEERVFAQRPLEAAFGTGAVVAGDIDDERVVAVGELLHGIDHAAQLVVAVRGIASEYFHHPGIEALLIGIQRIPRGQTLGTNR